MAPRAAGRLGVIGALLAASAQAITRPPGPAILVAWQGDLEDGYALASYESPSQPGELGLIARLGVDYLYYGYFDGAQDTRVLSPGADLGIGGRWRPPGWSVGTVLTLGVRRVATVREGLAPAFATETGPRVAVDLYHQATPALALQVLGNYAFANGYLWARVVAKQRVADVRRFPPRTVWAGLDVTARGNDDVRVVEGGASVELAVPFFHTSVALRAGPGWEFEGDKPPRLGLTAGMSVYLAL